MKKDDPEKETKIVKEEKKVEVKNTEKTEVKAPEKPPEQKSEVKAIEQPAAPVVQKRAKPRIALVHVFSSKNDTIITATDQSGAETLAWASGGMIVKADREEGRPYAAMQAAIKVVNTLKEKGVNMVHIRIRAPGGSGSKTPGSGAQAVVRTIARTGVRITRIDDVTPLPTDSMKRKGGRRGRRV